MGNRVVLIVEDNTDWQQIIDRAVRGMGFETVVTNDYDEANTIIKQDHPVLLISDLNLKDYDPYGDQGITFLTGIGVDERPPTIVVTGGGPEIIRRANRDLDVIAVLDKRDFAESKLEDAIKSAIGQA